MYLLLFGLAIALAGSALWAFNTILEFEKPAIVLKDDLSTIGPGKSIAVTVSDQKSGIRNVSVTISQEGRDQVVLSENYAGGTREQTLSPELNLRGLHLKDGPATITIAAEDHSWLKNRTTLSVETAIDTVPPQIGMISSAHNVNAGGTGVALYRVSEEVIRTGIRVGDRFFHGYPYAIQGKPCHIVYFAIPASASQGGLKILITARDKAGNESSVALPHLVREKKFKADQITLSRAFLEQKMPEFRQHDPRVPATPLEAFLFVNETLRVENTKTIQAAGSKSQPKALWEGTFLRMKNAAPMAGFAQARTYFFEGMAVSKSTHYGVDLASTERAPIESANNGVVVFTGYLGIYGNTVIVDHGLGLSSLYAHLSDIGVKVGTECGSGRNPGRERRHGACRWRSPALEHPRRRGVRESHGVVGRPLDPGQRDGQADRDGPASNRPCDPEGPTGKGEGEKGKVKGSGSRGRLGG